MGDFFFKISCCCYCTVEFFVAVLLDLLMIFARGPELKKKCCFYYGTK